jgi:DNA-binding transcriptional LysR family regulator
MVLLDLPHSREYFRDLLVSAGASPHTAYRSSSYEAVRGLVARGHGFSLLNQRPVYDTTYSGGEVVVRPIADELPALSIVLARMAAGQPTARARAIASAARDILKRTRTS